jgi:hypothetical protein
MPRRTDNKNADSNWLLAILLRRNNGRRLPAASLCVGVIGPRLVSRIERARSNKGAGALQVTKAKQDLAEVVEAPGSVGVIGGPGASRIKTARREGGAGRRQFPEIGQHQPDVVQAHGHVGLLDHAGQASPDPALLHHTTHNRPHPGSCRAAT